VQETEVDAANTLEAEITGDAVLGTTSNDYK
jgi:hypothetical protein